MIIADTEAELVEVVRDLDAAGEPVLIFGGGSNLLVGDDGFDGTVVKIATRGIAEDVAACSGAVITVAAGEVWDDLVAYAVERGWSGLEAMSGIPGLVGATPIQNVGAYGAEVSQTDLDGPDAGPDHRAAARPSSRSSAASATGRPASRPNPAATSCSSVTFQLRLGLAVGPDPLPGTGPGARRRGRRSRLRRPTYARPCWPCAGPRAWCWTTTITTPGAPARSSPTRSSSPAAAAPAGRRAAVRPA